MGRPTEHPVHVLHEALRAHAAITGAMHEAAARVAAAHGEPIAPETDGEPAPAVTEHPGASRGIS